jgi:hypothetical protein
MSTYLDLQNRIAQDYLNRSDFTDQIKRAIQAAIRHYERRRWRFNETASTIAASAGQTFLTLPANFLTLDYLQISAFGSLTHLKQRTWAEVLEMRAGSSNGFPTDYCIYQDQIELALVPDSAYNCPLYYIKSLTELSADGDTNSWTNGVLQDLIVYNATKQLWGTVLRNTNEAIKFAHLEMTALQVLDMEQVQFRNVRLSHTDF